MTTPSHEGAALERELDAADLRIAAASRRAADLERMIGVMRAMGGDIGPADRALMASYESLGLLSSRRAKLLRMCIAYRDADEDRRCEP